MSGARAAAAALAAALAAAAGARAPAAAPLLLADGTAAVSDAATVIDESTAGPAQVAVGGRLEVRLKAQFGTGYSWALAKPPAGALEAAGEGIVPSAGQQPPEGGFETQVFSFAAVAPGEAQLEFVHRRPWMPDDPSNRHITFTVKVVAR